MQRAQLVLLSDPHPSGEPAHMAQHPVPVGAAEFIVTAAPSDNRITSDCLWALGSALSWEKLCHMEHNLPHAFRTLAKP